MRHRRYLKRRNTSTREVPVKMCGDGTEGTAATSDGMGVFARHDAVRSVDVDAISAHHVLADASVPGRQDGIGRKYPAITLLINFARNEGCDGLCICVGRLALDVLIPRELAAHARGVFNRSGLRVNGKAVE